MSVTLPPMTDAQTQGWLALLDLHGILPAGWTLIGRQMVHLHCAERGAFPQRATEDLDTVLDVRARPHIVHDFTAALVGLGFEPDGTSPSRHQHRWVRDLASIDILIPAGVGERAASRRGVRGWAPSSRRLLRTASLSTLAVSGTWPTSPP